MKAFLKVGGRRMYPLCQISDQELDKMVADLKEHGIEMLQGIPAYFTPSRRIWPAPQPLTQVDFEDE